jgi:hypothetical protein
MAAQSRFAANGYQADYRFPVGSRFALHVRQASRFKSGAFNE